MSKSKSAALHHTSKSKNVLHSTLTVKSDGGDLESRTDINIISAEELPQKPPHRHTKEEIISLFTMSMMEHIVQSWEMIPDEQMSELQLGSRESVSSGRPSSSLRTLSKRRAAASASVLSRLLEATSQAQASVQPLSRRVSSSAHKQHRASRSHILKTSSTARNESVAELHQGSKLLSSQALEDVQEEGEQDSSQIQNESICSITAISDDTHWLKDGNVVILFTNGIIYEGHITQSLMNGEGLMIWPDGSLYEGDFTTGQITGKGYIEWPDLSWYEGEVCLGYRHGLGMYRATFADLTYSGKWFMGRKEGPGMLYYSENVNNHYNGDWVQNERHGLGMRSYLSHACYYGQWMNGLQHGIGTMVWSNNDLYQGSWENGKRCGYGEYTWSAFLNLNFVLPAENKYSGEWKNGKRCGNGILNLRNGICIKGQWKDGHKDGPGMIVYPNGTSVISDPLFINDHLVMRETSELFLNKTHSNKCAVRPAQYSSRQYANSPDTTRNTSKTKCSKYKQVGSEIKARNRALNSKLMSQNCTNKLTSIQNVKSAEEVRNTSYNIKCIEISYHLSRWVEFKYPELKFASTDEVTTEDNQHHSSQASTNDVEKSPSDETPQDYQDKDDHMLKNGKYIEITKEIDKEKKWLYDALIYHLPYMKGLYTKYACLFSEEDITCEPILFRLLLWQLLRDCDVHKRISLIELDSLFAANNSCLFESAHDPFEPIQVWQFLHILLDVSWALYTSKGMEEECAYGELASGFQKLLINDVMPNTTQVNGEELLKYIHVLPLEPIYLLYRGIGEAHTARDLLNYICGTGSTDWQNSDMKSIQSLLVLRGKNIFCNGRAIYLTNNKIMDFSSSITNMSPVALTYEENVEHKSFSSITPHILVTCMASICPQIEPVEELICNMDYKLTFLEFYEIIVASVLAIQKDVDKKGSCHEYDT